ncbi:MAG TPA: acyl-CoA dehydratase activase-related protein [Coriobacteriia bacterium]
MQITVGIPQGLLYYRYFPMWRAFFEALGARCVVSAPTTKATVRRGTELGENELCLPVKIFFGHCAVLDGEVDYLFIPRVVSVEKRELTCPKFLGLPDMTKALGLRSPILAPTIDLRRGRRDFLAQAWALGREIGGSPARIPGAIKAGLDAHGAWQRDLLEGTPLRLPEGTAEGRRFRIGVAGHPYNIYDPHISMDILKRLGERGIDVLVPEMVSHEELRRAVADVPKALFWTYEKEVYGAVRHWVDNGLVDGVVYMLSFACGPDSFVQVLIEDAVHSAEVRVPLLSLVIDEHSGEAGFVTRLEAFLDMLTRRDPVPS